MRGVPPAKLACHFHDTRGAAIACIDAALDHGIRVFDSSAGGTGGCPFAPGSPGNVSTEAVCELMRRRGFDTSVDEEALAEASAFLRELLGKVP